MTALPVADRIPAELWLRIFNGFTLSELLPIMLVCSLWRRVAFACDAYSFLVSLVSTSKSAVDFFILRLERSRSRLTQVVVTVEQACDALPTRVFPALASHFDHILGLTIKCQIFYGEHVMELVRNPAARLQDLVITLVPDASCIGFKAPVLPEDTLQCNPRDMQFVALRNVQLPFTGGISAFANVHTLLLTINLEIAAELDRLWPCFPALRNMIVAGSVIFSQGVISDHQAWRSLRDLDVRMERGCATDLFLRAPLHDIPTLRVCFPTNFPVEICLGHLDGELEMACWYDVDTVRGEDYIGPIVAISFTNRRSGRSRVLIRPFMHWFADEAASHCLRGKNIPDRITSLSLPDGLCAPVFSLLPPLDNLASLVLSYDQKLSKAQGIQYSFCPNLVTLTVRSNVRARVLSSELRQFVQTALLSSKSQAASQICLVLQRVELCVEQDDDVSLFKEISTW